jgi:hypothetical protein
MLININPKNGQRDTVEIVNLFVSFDPYVNVGTLQVSSPDMALPQFEVKEFNNRFAVIAFSGHIPAGTLNLTVHP